jgi:thiamine-monophosphate kinase
MRIQEIGGEFGWINRVRETYAGAQGEGLALSLGDDAAVLDAPSDRQLVVTTDMLVERVHFRRDWSDFYSIGWKAAAVNLSDIAAMGATPTFAFVAVGLTPNETVEGLDRMYDGFSDCLNRYRARIAGGDTNASPDGLILSVTLLGTAVPGQVMTRTGARLGDKLLVTGTLGSSALALALLTELGVSRAERVNKDLLMVHRRPQPRVFAGQAAAATGKVRAAMDISDGLLGDLKKFCAASNVGARIETAALPVADEMRYASDLIRKDYRQVALEGGEDYELLFAVPPADVDAVRAAVEETGTPVTVIGEIVKTGLHVIAPDGQGELPAEGEGWDHFAS